MPLSILKSGPIFLLLGAAVISAMVLENGANYEISQQSLHRDDKYWLTPTAVGFEQAPRLCEEGGSRFVAISDADKDVEVVIQVGGRITNDAWIGGRRNNIYNNFVWVATNQVFGYTNWPVGYDVSDKAGCVYYQKDVQVGLAWQVGDCNSKKIVVCERY